MNKLLRLLCAVAGLLAMSMASAKADTQDVAAAARGVVRVILVATDGDSAYFVGHGSGMAVAPDKILTNAHVVELSREEKSIVIGVIPSQGRRSYGGRVIAYSPGNDLALIQLDEGRIPPDTFYLGAVSDGQPVVAIGYPGTVDRAQGLNLQDMIEPVSPVKSSGTVSAGRSSRQFDTILHTAPMASGNSGGPLVDLCGRIVGLNSFGSVSEGSNDAEFGFAISNREIASFLRQAGVTFQRTSIACKSPEQVQEEEARRLAEELAKQEQTAREAAETQHAAVLAAHDKAEQQIIGERENRIALAAILLAVAVLCAGASGLMLNQGKRRNAIWSGAGGAALLLGAVLIFVTRPSFSDIEDRARLLMPKDTARAASGYAAAGDNLCRIDESRSRITISSPQDVQFKWSGNGCVNGDVQFVRSGERWSRTLLRAEEAAIDIRSFDPVTGTYTIDRFLPDAATVEATQQIRARSSAGQCTRNPQAETELATTEAEIRAILPARPNERLVYKCEKALSTTSG